MTWQAILFLHKCKQVQINEDGSIYLDGSKKTIITVKETPNSNVVEKDLSNSWASITTLLPYLKEKGLIKQTYHDSFALTYTGYHYVQTIISAIISFLLKSVIVPIFVSIITTLVSLFIAGSI